MQNLVCKKCGSNALELCNNAYECKNCNSKFLVSELENIVKLDNTVNNLDSLFQLAENEMVNKNFIKAIEHCQTISNLDSSDWKSKFYIEYCNVMSVTAINMVVSAADRFINSAEMITNLIRSKGYNETELKTIVTDVVKKVNAASHNLGMILSYVQPDSNKANEMYDQWSRVFNIDYKWGDSILSLGQSMGPAAAHCWIDCIDQHNKFMNTFQQWISPDRVQSARNTINHYVSMIRQYKGNFNLSNQQPVKKTSGGSFTDGVKMGAKSLGINSIGDFIAFGFRGALGIFKFVLKMLTSFF